MQEECITRKKVFNMMEDMKGKIRVYARVRPMLPFEADRGQKVALNIPDELTLDHVWKEKKREYQFDAVFAPDASQEKVSSRFVHLHITCSHGLTKRACISPRNLRL